MSAIRSLGGKVALVTGASSGIGRAIALALVNEGMSVCLVGRNSEELNNLVNQVRSVHARVVSCPADITQEKDVRRMETFFRDHFPRLDVLVHSAGLIAQGTLATASIEDFDSQWQCNVRSAYLITQLLLPQLRTYQGQVVFINSSVAVAAKAGIGQYAATKYALKAIADSLRDEVNKDGVRVLSVFLGRTATRMQQTIHCLEGKEYCPERLLQPEDVAETVLRALLLPKTAEVTDVHLRPMQKPASPDSI